MDSHQSVLVQLRAMLAQKEFGPNTRLPPERELAKLIGTTRGELRKALAVLEGEGLIWRHVGKGTFVGNTQPFETLNLGEIAQKSNPAEVMRARLMIEPPIAAEAAIHASPNKIAELLECTKECRAAQTWRQYETCDNRFHNLIAEATDNQVIVALYKMLAGIRRAVVWGRQRDDRPSPPPDHHSFVEHEAIVAAIADRDPAGARVAMLTHLVSVERNLFAARHAISNGSADVMETI